MYCPHCGKKVPSGKFCPYCGQRFQNPQDSQPFQGSDHSQAYQGPHTSPLFQGSSNVPPLREHSPQTDPPPSWGSSPRKPSSFVGFLVVAAVAVVAAVGLALGGGIGHPPGILQAGQEIMLLSGFKGTDNSSGLVELEINLILCPSDPLPIQTYLISRIHLHPDLRRMSIDGHPALFHPPIRLPSGA